MKHIDFCNLNHLKSINLDSYIKNISTNFEEVEEKELQEIGKSFLSEKTNKKF